MRKSFSRFPRSTNAQFYRQFRKLKASPRFQNSTHSSRTSPLASDCLFYATVFSRFLLLYEVSASIGTLRTRGKYNADAASSGRASLQTGRVGKEDYRERRAENFARRRESVETFNLRVERSIVTGN